MTQPRWRWSAAGRRADGGDRARRGRHRDRAGRLPAAAPDNRTTALLAGSVTALDTLGVWGGAGPGRAARVMRIVDDTARLLRAPEVCFDAARDRARRLRPTTSRTGYLLAALDSARRANCRPCTPIDAKADAVDDRRSSDVSVGSQWRTGVSARLAMGADGRRSLCRAAAGIETDSRSYPQTALTFNLAPSAAASATPRPNSTPKPARSRWCRCPGRAQAWCSW